MGVKDHPLFDPADDPKKQRSIHFIVVQRLTRGEWITAPRSHTIEDFPSVEALHAMYGGGKYRLFARDEGNRAITARKDWDLPGPPLPFPGEQPAPVAGAPAAAVQTPGLDPMIAVVLQLMAKSEERSMQMMQMMMAGQAQNAQQVAAMMNAQAQSAAQSNQQMMGIVAAIVARPAPDTSGAIMQALTAGMSIMREAQAPEVGGEGGGALDTFLQPILTGVGARVAEDMNKPSAPPPTAQEASGKPEGGSASGNGQAG
jgi:hypothetical protein